MRQCVTRGRPVWEAHAWTLHHDNALDHTALSIGQFFERNIAILEYPPYCIESWKRRMHKCFKVKGDYFKGI